MSLFLVFAWYCSKRSGVVSVLAYFDVTRQVGQAQSTPRFLDMDLSVRIRSVTLAFLGFRFESFNGFQIVPLDLRQRMCLIFAILSSCLFNRDLVANFSGSLKLLLPSCCQNIVKVLDVVAHVQGTGRKWRKTREY